MINKPNKEEDNDISISVVYLEDKDIEAIRFEKIVNDFKEINYLGAFKSVPEIHNFCMIHKPDLVVIDIFLEDNSESVEFAYTLSRLSIPFAFLTSHNAFAFEAFEISALHYIPKPLTHFALRELIDRYKKLQTPLVTDVSTVTRNPAISQQNVKRIYVNTQQEILILHLDELVYLEAQGAYTVFHLTEGREITTGKNLKYYSHLVLQNHDFVRVHRSYIINQLHLHSINKKKLSVTFIFKNGAEIQMASFKKADWMDRFYI